MKMKNERLLAFILTGVLILISSCLKDKGREGLARIKDFSKASPTSSEFCSSFIPDSAIDTADTTICLSSCDDGSHLGDEGELANLDQEIDDSGVGPETIAFLKEMIGSAAGICFEDVIERPSGQIFVKRNYCSCLNGKPDLINDCNAFCASKTDSTPVLFGSVTVGASVELNSELRDLDGWCKNELTGSDQGAPSCVMELSDEVNITNINITTSAGSNSFSANIANLPLNKTFIAKLREVSSGATSNEFQIRRVEPENDENGGTRTPLKITPVSMYTCIDRSGSCGLLQDPDEIYVCGFRRFFYFPSNSTPLSMPPGNQFVICHDTQFGINDSPLIPRLELIPQHYSLWSLSDIRFADQDDDKSPDINRMIKDRLVSEFNDARNINIFGLFNWPNRPSGGGQSSAPAAPNVGFYMQPFVDSISGRGFCPKQTHYNGADPLFKILKEVVGVDTEGIYLAVKEPEASDTGQQGLGVMIIRENLLNKIWFYFENGQHFVPDEVTAAQKTIMYYWPPDPVDPYTRKSTQKVYIVRSPEEIGNNGLTSGLPTVIRPPDKRFGCVPSLD